MDGPLMAPHFALQSITESSATVRLRTCASATMAGEARWRSEHLYVELQYDEGRRATADARCGVWIE